MHALLLPSYYVPHLTTLVSWVLSILENFKKVDADGSHHITAIELRELAWAAEQTLIFTYNYDSRDRAEKWWGLAPYVSCILWTYRMGLVTEAICVAFEIDTVKLIMSIFVRDFRCTRTLYHWSLISCASRILTEMGQLTSMK